MTTYTISEQQRSQWLDALAGIKRAWMNDMGSSCNATRDVDRAIHSLQSLQPNTKEPVAWMGIEGDNRVPLYTHPAPQAKPLTTEEVEQILAQHNYELHGDRARYIVRMTEQAHGVKP